jgi:hypothetical protein
MHQPVKGREHQPGQAAGLFRFGQDAQPLGQKQALGAAMAAIAQRADALDQWVGKGIDAARQRTQSSPNFASTRAASALTASSAPRPVAEIMIVSPIAAPSIISPMIEVPHTFEPSFWTSIAASCVLARVTNLALARA